MSVFKQYDSTKQPKCKIELHVHLDGAFRLTTVWELAGDKGISLGVDSYDEFCRKCIITKPCPLGTFLQPLAIAASVFIDDLIAIERMAYEYCEDSVKQHVLYSEVRYCPHLLCSKYISKMLPPQFKQKFKGTVTPEEVVISVNKGLTRGETDFEITVRSILCCIRPFPEWSSDILNLCNKFRNQGVVAIDIAGDEAEIMAHPEQIAVFQKAAELGIHRTAHAGEAGPASNITMAIKEMKAERIGHGYHVLEDDSVYKDCIQRGIHFETCPYSSYLTEAVPVSCPKHPIIKFAEDNINFSLNRDDPFLIQKVLDEEYCLLRVLGLTDVHFVRANFNAARSCFLPDDEKKNLLKQLKENYGVDTCSLDSMKSAI